MNSAPMRITEITMQVNPDAGYGDGGTRSFTTAVIAHIET
jgi:hypothetical protein